MDTARLTARLPALDLLIERNTLICATLAALLAALQATATTEVR